MININEYLDYNCVYIYNLKFHSDREMKQIHGIDFNNFKDSLILYKHKMLYIKSFLTFLNRDNPCNHKKRSITLSYKHNRIVHNYTQWLDTIMKRYGNYQGYLLADKEIKSKCRKMHMPRLLENKYIIMADTSIIDDAIRVGKGEYDIEQIFHDSARIEDIENIYNVAIEIDLHDYDLSIPQNIIALEKEKNRIKNIIYDYDLQPTIAYTTNRSVYMQYSFNRSLTAQEAINIKKFLLFRLYNELNLLADKSNMSPAILHHLKITLHKSQYQTNIVAPFKWLDNPYNADILYNYAKVYIYQNKEKYDQFWINQQYDREGQYISLEQVDQVQLQFYNVDYKNYIANFSSDQMFDEDIVATSYGTYKTTDDVEQVIKYLYNKNFTFEEIQQKLSELKQFLFYTVEDIKNIINGTNDKKIIDECNILNQNIISPIKSNINDNINDNIFEIKLNRQSHKSFSYNDNFEKMKEWLLSSNVLESYRIQSILDKNIDEIRDILQLDEYDLQPKTYTYSQAFKYIIQMLGMKLHNFFNIDVNSYHRKAMLHQIYHERRPSMTFNIIDNNFADCEVEHWYSHNKKPSGTIIDLFMWCLVSTCDQELSYKEALYNTIRFLAQILNIKIKSQLKNTFDETTYTKKIMKLYNEYKELYIQHRTKKSVAQKEMDDLQALIRLILRKIYENFHYSGENYYSMQHMITTAYLKEKLGWDKSKSYRMINQLLQTRIFNRIEDKNKITDNKLLSHLNDKHNIPYIFTLINFKEKIVISNDNIKMTRFDYARNCIQCLFEYEQMCKTTINRWSKQHFNNFNEFIPQIINVITDEKVENNQVIYTFLQHADKAQLKVKITRHKHIYNLAWKALNKFVNINNKILNDNICNFIQKNHNKIINEYWINCNYINFYKNQYIA